jgi:glycine cleavage system H lipoate-binding protein
MTHDFLGIYPAKLLEYALAVSYLLLFIPFWRYVQGGRKVRAAEAGAGRAAAAHAPAAALAHAPRAHAGATAPAGAGWFQVPAGVHLHPGHTWARLEPDGLVAVGADDFAVKLVGPEAVELPAPGDRIAQGEPAFGLSDGVRSVALLAPVGGTVVAVNAGARDPAALADAYGGGWLFKVKAPRLAADLRQLVEGHAARRLLDDAADQLALRVSPELGRVLQDGGTPVHGIARALAGDRWDELARGFFLT